MPPILIFAASMSPQMKKAFLQLHAAVFLAGFTAILGKLIELGEGMLVWYRLAMTVILLGLWMFWQKELRRQSMADVWKMMGVGAVIAAHWLFFYGSIKYANASVALVCLSAAGFFTALLEPLFFSKPIVWPELALGLLALAGIYIIFDFHPQYKLGIIFGILSSLGSAIFPIFNKQLVRYINPRTLTLYELTGGFLFLSLALPFYHMAYPSAYYWPTGSDWSWLLVLVVFCTILSFELQLRSLRHISAFTANLSYNLEPVYGIILAFMFLNESKYLHQQFFVGVSLIMLAVVLQMWRVRYGGRPKLRDK